MTMGPDEFQWLMGLAHSSPGLLAIGVFVYILWRKLDGVSKATYEHSRQIAVLDSQHTGLTDRLDKIDADLRTIINKLSER